MSKQLSSSDGCNYNLIATHLNIIFAISISPKQFPLRNDIQVIDHKTVNLSERLGEMKGKTSS